MGSAKINEMGNRHYAGGILMHGHTPILASFNKLLKNKPGDHRTSKDLTVSIRQQNVPEADGRRLTVEGVF
jgi:hypothetical protein